MIIWLITLVCDSIRASKEARKAREAGEARQMNSTEKRAGVDRPSASPHLERGPQMTSASSTKIITNGKDGSWQKLQEREMRHVVHRGIDVLVSHLSDTTC